MQRLTPRVQHAERLIESDALHVSTMPHSIASAYAGRVRLVDYLEHGDRDQVHDALHALRVSLHRLIDEAAADAWSSWARSARWPS